MQCVWALANNKVLLDQGMGVGFHNFIESIACTEFCT